MVELTFRKPMVALTFRKPNKHSKSITNWHLLSENPELSFAWQLGWPLGCCSSSKYLRNTGYFYIIGTGCRLIACAASCRLLGLRLIAQVYPQLQSCRLELCQLLRPYKTITNNSWITDLTPSLCRTVIVVQAGECVSRSNTRVNVTCKYNLVNLFPVLMYVY